MTNKHTDLFDKKISNLQFSNSKLVTENKEDQYFGGGYTYHYEGHDPIDITIVYDDDSKKELKQVISFEAWINRSTERSFVQIKEYANKIGFSVTNEGWIHYIEPMKITRNQDNSFNVRFYIAWNHDHDTATEYHYQNVPKDKVFELVTGPTYNHNGEDLYCFSIDEDRLKKFIERKIK